MIRILFLMAGPSGTTSLRLYREFEFIDDRIYGSRCGKEFIIHPRFSASFHRLHSYLLRFRPDIVHFAGHGAPGQLAFEDENGRPQIADQDMIETVFSILTGKIRLVFLNACYSAHQADIISRYVPVVIGMTDNIMDYVAIQFASSFYEGLASGLTISQAHRLGLHTLRLLNLTHEGSIPDLEHQINTIQMINNGESDPSRIRFTKRAYKIP